MNQSNIDAIYNLLDSIKVTKDNKKLIEETRKNMENGQYAEALEKLKLLNSKRKEEEAKPKKKRGRKPKKIKKEVVEVQEEETTQDEPEENDTNSDELKEDGFPSDEPQDIYSDDYDDYENNSLNDEYENFEEENSVEDEEDSTETDEKNDNHNSEDEQDDEYQDDDEFDDVVNKYSNNEQETTDTEEKQEDDEESLYPKELSNIRLEHAYIGMLLTNPKYITKFYFTFQECYFEDDMALNNYKSVLFTESSKFTPEKAKQGFNFAKETQKSRDLKTEWKEDALENQYDMEILYIALKKLFVLRKAYTETPIKEAQDRIVDIVNYKLYNQMSVEEIESAIRQVNDTGKFKRAIISEGLSEFLKLGENNLTEGLQMPFPIISSVFKGIRKGETMAFAMPSNSGKSRFTINLAAYTSLVHKKKVLIISNEMSEEKMRLCLITTILNNPEIQKLHGQDLHKTEGELLEFKFRPDDTKKVKVDKDGFVVQEENETRKEFVQRLTKVSSEFNKTIKATNWANEQIENSMYFINITDHTNDELKKVIMNYYYKEKIEYIFYDTLKTDTEHIGSGEEIKKTATILSNLAQNFDIFICSTLQLTESSTLPVNLTVNDLAVSRTVKEVLDTLCLIKQINRENLDDYEYSLKEVDTKFFDLKRYDDPDVRYYACVVDKNRAGAKPKIVFRLNLAYNSWEELGYLKLKQSK